MLGIGLALGSSLAWGISDFLGGLSSRRVTTLSVLLVSQPVGLLAALAIAIGFGGDSLAPPELAFAAGAGAAVVVALGAFYRAMALGSVSVVATIGSLGVLVPIAAGLIRGEDPAPVQMAGAAAALCGVVLVAREPDPAWRAANRRALGLAAVAALGFGAFILGIDAAAGERPAWTVVVARLGGVAVLVCAAAVVRPGMRIPATLIPAVLTIGVFDILANTLFALATTRGLLSLVAVAGSLYPAVTILLARLFLGERLRGPQRLGLGLAMTGILLIASAA